MKTLFVAALVLISLSGTAAADCRQLEYAEVKEMTQADLDTVVRTYLRNATELMIKKIENPLDNKGFDNCIDELTRIYRIYKNLYPNDVTRFFRGN